LSTGRVYCVRLIVREVMYCVCPALGGGCRSQTTVPAPDQPVWRETLLHDRRTPVPDQVAFRLDWSAFLAQQPNRACQAISLLAEGYKRCKVPASESFRLTQRMNRAWRDWIVFRERDTQNASPADRPKEPAPENSPPDDVAQHGKPTGLMVRLSKSATGAFVA
jgi:hypothetical protein